MPHLGFPPSGTFPASAACTPTCSRFESGKLLSHTWASESAIWTALVGGGEERGLSRTGLWNQLSSTEEQKLGTFSLQLPAAPPPKKNPFASFRLAKFHIEAAREPRRLREGNPNFLFLFMQEEREREKGRAMEGRRSYT